MTPTETPVESRAFPRYRCHKEVCALKIANIEVQSPSWAQGSNVAVITPEDKRYQPFAVTWNYINDKKPEIGGYWIMYDNEAHPVQGLYYSYVSAEAFESGYTLIDPPA